MIFSPVTPVALDLGNLVTVFQFWSWVSIFELKMSPHSWLLTQKISLNLCLSIPSDNKQRIPWYLFRSSDILNDRGFPAFLWLVEETSVVSSFQTLQHMLHRHYAFDRSPDNERTEYSVEGIHLHTLHSFLQAKAMFPLVVLSSFSELLPCYLSLSTRCLRSVPRIAHVISCC